MNASHGFELYRRYFFYGWLFRDASRGNYWERAAALAHNREQSRWLPVYMWRWLVLAFLTLGLGKFCEISLDSHALSVPFYILMTTTVAFNTVTAACWRLLRSST
jgi:hypothetical protein